jgi:hypothetical protein
MCLLTVVLAALETAEVALLRIPNGRPRMLLLHWLDELVLVLVLLELLLLPKSELNRLVRVVVVEDEELVVRASPAVAFWNGAAIHRATVRSRVTMRSELADEGRKCMVSRLVCRPFCRGRGG